MLLPRTYAWTQKQKVLIVTFALVVFAALGLGIYAYEHYYRGPTDAVFLGTWRDTTPIIDAVDYYRFKPDGTFDLIIDGMGSIDVVAIGKWYAGGQNIYMRVPMPEDPDEPRPRRNVLVWHIVDISPEKILVRDTQHGTPIAWERYHDALPTASNQAIQLTARRSER